MQNYMIIEVDNNQEATVKIDNIVKFSGNEYDSVRKLIGNNKVEIEQLGMKLPQRENGQTDLTSATFNEQQTMYIISLLKNTPEVKTFKLKVAKEFYQQKELIKSLLKELQELKNKQNELLFQKDRTISLLQEAPKEYKKITIGGKVYMSAAAVVKDKDYSAKDFKNFVKELKLINEKPKLQSYWELSAKGELSDLVISGDTNNTPYYDAETLTALYEEYLQEKENGRF
jgi:hypothetical protein